MKKVLLITQYFSPEIFQINDLTDLLLEMKYHVCVIAPNPSYPSYQSIKRFPPKKSHKNLKIIRFPVFLRRENSFSNILNHLSFLALSFPISIFTYFKFKPDIIFTPLYSPITSIFPAFIISFFPNKISILWIFDLWPDSLSIKIKESFKTKIIYSPLNLITKIIYKNFKKIAVASPQFLKSKYIKKHPSKSLLLSWEKNDYQIKNKSQTINDPDLNICSVGNIGYAHDIDLINSLLLNSKGMNINFTFAGGGSLYNKIKSFCKYHKLEKVTFKGYVNQKEALKIISESHFALVPFTVSSVSNTIPYRFISSLAVSTPSISFNKTATSELIKEQKCGLVYRSEKVSEIEFLKELKNISYKEFKIMSEISGKLYLELFSPRSAKQKLKKLIYF